VRFGLRRLAAASAILVVSCGRPDASGVYLAKSGREATLIQLAQAKDGAVTGRVEVIAIGPDGALTDTSATLDGAASRRGLTFRPTGPWFGGASASGSFTRGGLTISRGGGAVKARKASLGDFQKAVSQLKATAAAERRRAVDTPARQAAETVQAEAFEGGGDQGPKLQAATRELQADAAKLNDGVSAAPDFGRQASDNTARVAQLAQQARAAGGADRSRRPVLANQVIVETNQIDVARTRYAIDLDRIVAKAAPLAMAVQRFCDTPPAAQAGQPCAAARAAATDFESALVRASTVLKGHKQTIQTELARQNQIVQKIGG
jgi:hypothetical protein